MKLLRKILFFGLAAGLLITTLVAGLLWQIEQDAEVISVTSVVLDEVRPVKVYLPRQYHMEPNRRYSVLYTIDGERVRNSSLAVLIARLVTEKDLILVAVDAIGKRTRDFRLEGATAFGTDTSGKASRFLDFFERELIPNIDATYRTSPERLLAGHSYGGLFAFHTMSLKPHLFDGYLAFSPALNADDRALDMLGEYLRSGHVHGKWLYMNLGWETLHEYDVRFWQAADLLEQEAPKGFRYQLNSYWLIHGAVPIPGYFEALGFYSNDRNAD